MDLINDSSQLSWCNQNAPVVPFCIHILLPRWQGKGGWEKGGWGCVCVCVCWGLVSTVWAPLPPVPIQGMDSYIKNTIGTLPAPISLLLVATTSLCVHVCACVCVRIDKNGNHKSEHPQRYKKNSIEVTQWPNCSVNTLQTVVCPNLGWKWVGYYLAFVKRLFFLLLIRDGNLI